jgi:hypothetical protein
MDESERAIFIASSTATYLYKIIITFGLLLSGFLAFPEHKMLIALSVFFVRHGLSAVSSNTADAMHRMNEIAVRESYQTVLIRNEDGLKNWKHHDEFREEVRRRVESDNVTRDLEKMFQDSPVSKLQLIGHLVKAFLFLVLVDLIYFSIAFALTYNV